MRGGQGLNVAEDPRQRLTDSLKTELTTIQHGQNNNVGPDSSVSIATRYGLDGPGSNPGGARFSAPVQTGPAAHPASCTMGTGSVQGLRRPGRGAYHPPNVAPKLKKE
jgi:hypothetical protein